jgi:hypothetical protein
MNLSLCINLDFLAPHMRTVTSSTSHGSPWMSIYLNSVIMSRLWTSSTPSYPIYPNTCPGISYKNPVHLIHLTGFGLYCLTRIPSSPKTLTYAFLTLLCNPKKPKQSNYLFLHKLHHYISHIPSPLTYTYKKPRSLSMNQHVFSIHSSQTPRKPPIHDTFNSFLSYPPHNIIITFIKIYIYTFLLPTRYPPHNSFIHPSPYLYANTYPNPLSLSPIIQNISLAFLLPQCGDVELNPGPCSNIAPNLPPDLLYP